MRRVNIAILLLLLLPVAFAANDPGHDTLYVLKLGDNITGSLNISEQMTADLIQVGSRFFGDYLDIRANGTIATPTSNPAIQAAASNLYLDSMANVYINSKAGTSGIVQIGDTSTNGITLDVRGTIQQQGTSVCLSNGTNCITGTNEGNVSSVTAGSGLTDSGTASDPVFDINLDSGSGLAINSDALGLIRTCGSGQVLKWSGSAWACQDDNDGSGVSSAGGWTNNSENTSTTLNVGIGTANPTSTLQVVGDINASGDICTTSGNCLSDVNPGGATAAGWNDTGSTVKLLTNTDNVDANTLYVDNNAGRVGIGTGNPNSSLDVIGTVNATKVCDKNGNCLDDAGTVNSGVANKLAYYASGGTAVDDLAGTNNGAIYYDASSAVQAGTLPIESGGTGLTSSADDALMVGSSTTTWQTKTLPSCSAPGSFLQYNTGTNAFNCVAESGDITDVLAGTGINITDSGGPSPTVSVNNTWLEANYVGQNEYPNLDTDNTDDLTTSTSFNGDVSGSYNNLQLGSNIVGDAEMNYSQVTLSDFTNDASFLTSEDDPQVGTVNNEYVCLGQSGSIVACDDAGITYVDATDALTVTGSIDVGSSGLFANSSNVGIGTASPAYKLDVLGDTGTANVASFQRGDAGATQILLKDTAHTWGLRKDGNDDFIIRDVTGGFSPVFIQDGTPDNTITTLSSGNVGIGTATPGATLDVAGSAATFKVGSDPVLLANTTSYKVEIGDREGAQNGALFTVDDPNQQFTFMNGKVGIGIDTPAYDLQINGSSGTTIMYITNTAVDGDPSIVFGLPGTRSWQMGIDDGDSDKLKIASSLSGSWTNTRLTIDTDGKVGIGTASPDEQFSLGKGSETDVKTYTNADEAYLTFYQAQNFPASSNYDRVLDIVAQPSNAGSWIRFLTGTASSAPSANMVISDDGDIGIGTDSPETLLTIKGTSAAADGIGSANNPALRLIGDASEFNERTEIQFKASPNSGEPIAAISGEYTKYTGSGDTGGDLVFSTRKSTAAGGLTERMSIDKLGLVTIGTGTAGNASGAGDLYVTSDIEYDGNLYGPGADLAEQIHTSDEVEAGDVVIADPKREETIKKSTHAYDTSVIGVVSSEPGIILSKSHGDVPLALSGRVPIKVSAENGPINPGDLLTTSNTPGRAMRCTSREACQGALVGKALGKLEKGVGTITGLVVLG